MPESKPKELKEFTEEERLAAEGFRNRMMDVEVPTREESTFHEREEKQVNSKVDPEKKKKFIMDQIIDITEKTNLSEDEILGKLVDFIEKKKQSKDNSLTNNVDKVQLSQKERTVQASELNPIIQVIDNADLQNSTSENLEKIQNKVINVVRKQNLTEPKPLDDYSQNHAAQDRQEIMQNDKLPFKDKIYSVVNKLAEACHISKLSNYCQKKLDEHAMERQKASVKANNKSHVEKLQESRSNSSNKSSTMAK